MQVTKVWWDGEKMMAEPIDPTTIYQEPAPVQERNFCERCGKRLGSGIHTCTPPAAPVPENFIDALRFDVAMRDAQEPVAWKWHQAPVKTSWGHDMVVADLAIDKDNTVSVYCERDQTTEVEAMFTPPAVQRQWVGLKQSDMPDGEDLMFDHQYFIAGMAYAANILMKKNT